MRRKAQPELPPWPPQVARAAADSSSERGTAMPAAYPAIVVEPDDVREERSRIVKTVVASIGLGLFVLIVSLVTDDSDAAVARRLSMGMALTLALYAIVSLLVGRRLDVKTIRPRLVEGPVGRAVAMGLLCGAGA